MLYIVLKSSEYWIIPAKTPKISPSCTRIIGQIDRKLSSLGRRVIKMDLFLFLPPTI
jgi:hypothetical protein